MHGAIADAGQIRLELIWTTEGRPEGQDTGRRRERAALERLAWAMYPAIQSSRGCGCF